MIHFWRLAIDPQTNHAFNKDIHRWHPSKYLSVCLSVWVFFHSTTDDHWPLKTLSIKWKDNLIDTVLTINNRFQMLKPAQCPFVVTLTDSPQMCNSVTQSHILSYCFSRLLSLLPNSHRNYAQTVARWRLYRLSNSTLTHDPWSLKIRSGIKIHESLQFSSPLPAT